uniref:Uncharacterized protein n=1 Tax=Oryza punctata TaxID=4537 RepID=A0A0E0L683_ORYPU
MGRYHRLPPKIHGTVCCRGRRTRRTVYAVRPRAGSCTPAHIRQSGTGRRQLWKGDCGSSGGDRGRVGERRRRWPGARGRVAAAAAGSALTRGRVIILHPPGDAAVSPPLLTPAVGGEDDDEREGKLTGMGEEELASVGRTSSPVWGRTSSPAAT